MLTHAEATALVHSDARRKDIVPVMLDLAIRAEEQDRLLAKYAADIQRLRTSLADANRATGEARSAAAGEVATLRGAAVAVAAAWAAHETWRVQGGPDGYARHRALGEAISALALLI